MFYPAMGIGAGNGLPRLPRLAGMDDQAIECEHAIDLR
jgi:hypothetical protein